MDDARDPALFEQCVVLMVMDGTKKKKTKEERNPPPPTAPTGRALLFLGLWRDWAPNFPGRKLQARSEQELYVKGSERRERKWSPSEAGQWEEKERERATKKRVLLEHHLSGESRRREGKIARPSIRGKEEKKLKQREWKPWLSARAPCMETTSILFDPSCRPPLRDGFSTAATASGEQVPCSLPGPGRNQQSSILFLEEESGSRGAVRRRAIDRLPSTKEAAPMPPCRPLVAGRFLQSTYPSHGSASRSRAPSSCDHGQEMDRSATRRELISQGSDSQHQHRGRWS